MHLTRFKLRFVCLLVWLTGVVHIAGAQSYCHSESNTPFTFLTAPTILTEDQVWDDSRFMIPVGFDFLFQGNLYPTLTVESNGRVYFSNVLGENDDPSITIFGGNASEIDMIDRGYYTGIARSPIGYQLFENPTDTFLVIEYKNVGFYKDQPDLSDSISFQLKLYRNNGKIEIHIGPHKIIDTNSFYTTGVSIGLGNPMEDNGYFLTGDPASPVASKYPQPLEALPDEGMLYTFVPVLPHPTLHIVSDPTDGCFDAATSYTFTATVSNEHTPSLQWMKNGIAVADENDTTFVAGQLNINDTITCLMTLSAACPSALPVTSNRIIISRPVAAVSISATATTICAGESIRLNATIENEGENPVFKWIKNADTLTTTSPDYLVSELSDQDVFKCMLISNERCVANAETMSDPIVVTVLPMVTPQVSITASKDSICTGDSILYTASPVLGGPSPSYLWTKNGSSIGSNVASLYLTSLNNEDIIRCELTSSLACATGPALSETHTAQVRTYVPASISIHSTLTELCAGQNVSITATPVNGGSHPSYTWKNNGIEIGNNSPVLSASNFANGDSIVCVMTSSHFCSNTAQSGFIKLTVYPVLTPSVSIVANKDSICSGESLLFTATPANTGTASYQWKINGNNAGTNSTFFSSSTLSNEDLVTCIVTPGPGCYAAASAASNTVSAHVVSYSNASVSITSDAATVCTTTPVTFTASPVNGGSAPAFQWYKNGSLVSSGSNSYTASGFAHTDQISCTMASDMFCIKGSPATSNILVMTVVSAPTSTITIQPSQNPICAGGNITFQALVSGIANPVYQWQLNNIHVGISSATFSAAGFSNQDEVLCKITNSIDCSGGLPTSNIVSVNVSSDAEPHLIIEADKDILFCTEDTITYTALVEGAGSPLVYKWEKNSVPVGTNSPQYKLEQPANNDLITCTVTTEANCQTVSNTLSVSITPCLSTQETQAGHHLSVFPNPFAETISIELEARTGTTLTLLEATGKKIRNQFVAANTYWASEWIVAELPYGIYFLKVTDEYGTTLQKLLKQ
jgi:hypothetical protein